MSCPSCQQPVCRCHVAQTLRSILDELDLSVPYMGDVKRLALEAAQTIDELTKRCEELTARAGQLEQLPKIKDVQIAELEIKLITAQERIKELVEALEFYADRLHHQRMYDEDRGSSSTVEEDDGIIARQALLAVASRHEGGVTHPTASGER